MKISHSSLGTASVCTIYMVWNRFLYRLGTCFHNTFIPASFISFQAVLPKKDQRDVGLDGNRAFGCCWPSWGPGERGLAQRRHPVAGSRGGWDAGELGQAGPSQERAAVVCEGEIEAYSVQTEHRETRIARVVYTEKL